jgi:hypothetical protein
MELPFSCRELECYATNSGGNASYNLKANAVSINTNTSTSSSGLTILLYSGNQNYALEVTQGTYYHNKKSFR